MVWDSSLAKDDSPDAWLSTLALPKIFFLVGPLSAHHWPWRTVAAGFGGGGGVLAIWLPPTTWPFWVLTFSGVKTSPPFGYIWIIQRSLGRSWYLDSSKDDLFYFMLCYITIKPPFKIGDYVWKFFQASNKQIQDYKQPWAPQTYLLRGLAGK